MNEDETHHRPDTLAATGGAAPKPGPPPSPRPTPGPPPAAPQQSVAGGAPASAASRFGRVGDDGTVYVRTAAGERAVGSYPGASPQEALAYFARKYDELVAQVDLFEQRLTSADVPVGEIDAAVRKLRAAVADVHAVGDLTALQERVDALVPLAAERRRQVEAARGAARDAARARRTALVEEAEGIAALSPELVHWRSAGQRMTELFEAWRIEQKGGAEAPGVRLDRRSEDQLWKRFSQARTAFDRKRRQYFAHLDETHAQARAAKEALVRQAEALRESTDWGPTAAAFKRLMDSWRAAGRAARKDDDELWERFRAAQETFFAARHADQAVQDAELAANLAVKEALLVEAEALLPITDLRHAKARLRELQERWEAAGRVPRSDLDRLERRMRAVEQAVRAGEDVRWRSSNPEARARARSAVDQLETAIADLEADLLRASDQGKAAKVAQTQAALTARREWLQQARRALEDFGG